MAKVDSQGLMPSMLDRLMDSRSRGTGRQPGYNLAQIIDAIRRDLEELLNTHQMYTESLEQWPEAAKSLLTYGLPDFSAAGSGDRVAIAKKIEDTIMRFEPRLRNVRATVVEQLSPSGRTVKFNIDAQINVDPAPEVAFETVVELSTGRASIQNREQTS